MIHYVYGICSIAIVVALGGFGFADGFKREAWSFAWIGPTSMVVGYAIGWIVSIFKI